MLKHWLAGVAAVATMSAAACGAPTTTPAPTSPPAPTSTAQPASAAQPTTVVTKNAALAIAQNVTLVLDGAASQASYRARETLVGRSLPSEAVGTTKKVSGTIVLNGSGDPIVDQSRITVDLTALQSDESRRDNFIKGNTLNTKQYPTATFVVRDVEGLPSPLPTSGDANFQLVGDLTVHGVTRPVTWQVTANFANGTMSGSATTTVQITDFGMTPPKAGPVLSIEDQLKLELVFAAERQG
jgi:polyisoprenoid-binding protein YceI